MRAEHLQQWLWETRKAYEATAARTGSVTMTEADMEIVKEAETEMETETAATGPMALSHWKRMVVLTQKDFQEGRLEEESTWKVVVIIPRGGRYYYGIGLTEVVWKVVTVILHFRLTISIDFHEVLHGFWAGPGTGTTSLEAKLPQQLMAMR